MKVTPIAQGVPNIQIELSGEEAMLLRSILGRVAGKPNNPLRRLANALHTEMSLVPNMPKTSNVSLSRMARGEITAAEEWDTNWQNGWVD